MKKIDVFSQWTPLNLNKSDHKEEKEYISVEGIASTESIDVSGEIILQDGLDFSYALRRGFLNLEHKSGPKYVLGHPTEIFKTSHNGKKATGIKGVLYTKKEAVKDILETAYAMKAAGNGRQLGFSIEGSVLERDKRNPKIITKARVLNVSITSSPCNPDATMSIVKSILADMKKEVTDEEYRPMKKDNEYSDVYMSRKQCMMAKDYADKLNNLLQRASDDYDLPEWCQAKITKSLDYLQATFHYLEIEQAEYMNEMKSYKEKYEKMLEEMKPTEEGPGIHPTMEEDDDYTTNDKPYGVKVVEKVVDEEYDIDKIVDQDIEMEESTDMSPIQPESLEGEVSSEDFSDEEIKELVMRILQDYPQLSNERVMEIIHSMLKR